MRNGWPYDGVSRKRALFLLIFTKAGGENDGNEGTAGNVEEKRVLAGAAQVLRIETFLLAVSGVEAGAGGFGLFDCKTRGFVGGFQDERN
jgi:hypothetical protein